jgi:hypothetical protein
VIAWSVEATELVRQRRSLELSVLIMEQVMARSIKEAFDAARQIVDRLIQTEEMICTDCEQRHVRAVVEESCPGWELCDQANAVLLAWLAADMRGDNWEWADHSRAGDLVCGAAFADLRISHALRVYAGVASPLSDEEREDAFRTRHNWPDPRRDSPKPGESSTKAVH